MTTGIPNEMVKNLRALVDTFAERSRQARGQDGNHAAIAWAEAAADLAVALTINEPGEWHDPWTEERLCDTGKPKPPPVDIAADMRFGQTGITGMFPPYVVDGHGNYRCKTCDVKLPRRGRRCERCKLDV